VRYSSVILRIAVINLSTYSMRMSSPVIRTFS
jgi:hypothetical protein